MNFFSNCTVSVDLFSISVDSPVVSACSWYGLAAKPDRIHGRRISQRRMVNGERRTVNGDCGKVRKLS